MSLSTAEISGPYDNWTRIFDSATMPADRYDREGKALSAPFPCFRMMTASPRVYQIAYLWNLDTGFQVGPLLPHESIVSGAASYADVKLLVSGSSDQNAYAY